MKELGKVMLHGVRFYGYHGVNPEEKKLGQWFELDVEIWGDFARAAESDDILGALNYSHVYKIIKGIVEGPSTNLLENLAHRVAARLLELPLARKVLIRVKKPGVPLAGPLAYAGVEMTRCKDEE